MIYTRLLLTDWGRWAKGALPEMPTMSSIEKARIGRGGKPSYEMPAHIAEVDKIVCHAPQPEKSVLIAFYTRSDALHLKALSCRMNRWRFRRVLQRAESYVEIHL